MVCSLSHHSFDMFLLVHLSILGTGNLRYQVKISATNDAAENSETPVTVFL